MGGGGVYFILPRFRGVNLLYIAFFMGNSEGEIILFRHFFFRGKGRGYFICNTGSTHYRRIISPWFCSGCILEYVFIDIYVDD